MVDVPPKQVGLMGPAKEKGMPAFQLNQFWTQSGLVLVLHGLGLLGGYVLHLSLVRWMGGTEYGVFSYANSIVALVGVVVSLGFPVAAVRFVPEYEALGKYNELRGFWRFGGWAIFVTSGLAGGCLVLLDRYFDLFPAADTEVMTLALLLVLPLTALVGWQNEFFRGQHRVRAVAWQQNLITPLFLLAGGFAIFTVAGQLTAGVFILLMAFAAFGSWAFFALWQTLNWRHRFSQISASFPLVCWLKVSLPLCLTGLFLTLMAQTDVLLIGSMLGAQKAGVYALSARIGGVTCLFLNVANVLAAPIYARLYANGQREEMARFARLLSHAIFWPAVVVAAILFLSGRSLLGWFGPEFSNGYGVMLILVVGQLANAGVGSVGFLADVTGLQTPAAFVRGGCALLNVLLSWALIKFMGMLGAALATALCLVIWNLLLHRLVKSQRQISPSIWSTMVHQWRV